MVIAGGDAILDEEVPFSRNEEGNENGGAVKIRAGEAARGTGGNLIYRAGDGLTKNGGMVRIDAGNGRGQTNTLEDNGGSVIISAGESVVSARCHSCAPLALLLSALRRSTSERDPL